MGTVIAILQILPALIEAIKAVEQAIPGAGNGQSKLDLILNTIQAVDSKLSSDVVVKVIGIIVGIFNKTGVFAKAQ